VKKAVIFGERNAGLVDVPDPEPFGDWAVVKVHASAMCTEYKGFDAGRASDHIGHEGAGEVVAVEQPGHVRVGDRVVILPQYPCDACALCRAGDSIYCQNSINVKETVGTLEGSGTFAQYALKPVRRLLPIPEGVSYEHATMAIDGIGASFGGLRAIGVDALHTVLVTGLGPVGLGGVANARFQGARVFGVEPVAWRRERALEMGAERVFDPRDDNVLEEIMALTDGRGVDRALDCSGTVEGERVCIDAVRRRGRVAFVGECRQDLRLRIGPDMLTKGLLLTGAWCFNTGDYPRIMQIIRESPLMDLLVSHVMSMSRIQDALELLVTGQCAKVVLKPWE